MARSKIDVAMAIIRELPFVDNILSGFNAAGYRLLVNPNRSGWVSHFSFQESGRRRDCILDIGTQDQPLEDAESLVWHGEYLSQPQLLARRLLHELCQSFFYIASTGVLGKELQKAQDNLGRFCIWYHEKHHRRVMPLAELSFYADAVQWQEDSTEILAEWIFMRGDREQFGELLTFRGMKPAQQNTLIAIVESLTMAIEKQ